MSHKRPSYPVVQELPAGSVARNQNGQREVAEAVLAPATGGRVYLYFVSRRLRRSLRPSFLTTEEGMDSLCRKWLESRGEVQKAGVLRKAVAFRELEKIREAARSIEGILDLKAE